MLGSLAEADDAVQDAWLRVSRSGADEVENLGGWLTTIVARVCLNMLRSRRVRREESLDVHLPDPVITPEGWSRCPIPTSCCGPTSAPSAPGPERDPGRGGGCRAGAHGGPSDGTFSPRAGQ